MKPIMVITTVSSINEAKKISNLLIKNHLAACVNIIPGVESIYSWQGKIVEDKEIILIIKSIKSSEDELYRTVKKNHSYSTPELITLKNINTDPQYLEWMLSSIIQNEK